MKISKRRFAEDSRVIISVVPKCMADDINSLVCKYGTKSGAIRAALTKGLPSLIRRMDSRKAEGQTNNQPPEQDGAKHTEGSMQK